MHHNGYGFIQFLNEDDARKAADAENGTLMQGRRLSEYDII